MDAPRIRRAETAPTRQVVAAAIALLVLGAIGALQAGRAGASFMFDLELVHPPLVRAAPMLDPAPTPRLARRVYLVIVDGLRLDRSYELPYFDELRRRGADTEASSHYPTWSVPNYVSILAGVPPSASGVRTNYHTTPVTLDTLMDRARAAGLRVATATDYALLPRLFLRSRNELPLGWLGDPLDPYDRDDEDREYFEAMEDPVPHAGVHNPATELASPFDDARYAPWPGGFREAATAVLGDDADLVVLLIGAPDVIGHARGAADPAYRAAAAATDHVLSRVLSRVDLEQDAIVITSDHGHTNSGGHGGTEPEVMTVPLIAAGAGIRPGSTALDAGLIDIAPTISALLGISAPGHGLGRTLTELLALDPTAGAQRATADHNRLTATRGVVAAAEARAGIAVVEHRAARIGLVVSGVGIATFLAVLLIRRRVLRLDVRVLLVSVPTFFLVYFMLIATVGAFSPSLTPARGHIASVLVRWAAIGAVFQLLASAWALRGAERLADRLAMANGIAWTSLMLTMAPAGMIWAFFPPPYVTLPGPVWLVLIPAVEVAVACAAVNVALILLLEVIVFAARAWHRTTR
ncbi:MAG: alkaline phosphatase family protein [Kofleriaceae bacterium]